MVDLDIDTIERWGKVLGWFVIVVTAGYSMVWRIRRHGERLEALEAKVFPADPARKLLNLNWHDRLTAECDARRSKDMEILASHILEELRKDIGKLREEISALHERTKPRRWDDSPSP